MLLKLFLLFTIVPFIELALLIRIGTVIGTLDTLLLIIITGIIGAFMVRAAGIQCAFRIQSNLRDGIFPADELFNGFLILVSGVLLLTPGLLTDTAGLLLLFPPSREMIKSYVKRYIKSNIEKGKIHTDIDI